MAEYASIGKVSDLQSGQMKWVDDRSSNALCTLPALMYVQAFYSAAQRRRTCRFTKSASKGKQCM
jgi:hypothetical protein